VKTRAGLNSFMSRCARAALACYEGLGLTRESDDDPPPQMQMRRPARDSLLQMLKGRFWHSLPVASRATGMSVGWG